MSHARYTLHTRTRGRLHAETAQRIADLAQPGDISEDTRPGNPWPFVAWYADPAGLCGHGCATFAEACAVGPRSAAHAGNWQTAADTPAARLEYLRAELRAERISYAELAELQALADGGRIPPDDAEMREAAGLPEHAPAR